jgi:hypothetical protein
MVIRSGFFSRWLAFAIALSLPLYTVASIALTHPAAAQASKTVNVELILDSSGSMADVDASGQSRIDAAKQVLDDVIDQLPEKEGVNVGFRVYGHKGNNTQAGKAESCASSELKVPVKGVDKNALRAQVATYEPVGWTPIALSLQESGADFPKASDTVKNAVVLVTDGLETCGGDPCAASRAIKNSPQAVTTNVIGFALADEDQANLQCIADESGGLLLGAGNASELSDALFQVLEDLDVVVVTGTLEIEAIGGYFPKATIDGIASATDSNPNGKPFTATLTNSNAFDLDEGTYDVHWANPSGAETHTKVAIEGGKKTVIRGSIFRFPHGSGQTYTLKAIDGTLIWEAPIEAGDWVWVMPGTYRLELEKVTGDAVLLSMDVQTLPGAVTQFDVLVSP